MFLIRKFRFFSFTLAKNIVCCSEDLAMKRFVKKMVPLLFIFLLPIFQRSFSFESYPFNRPQFISYDLKKLEPFRLACAVPQGSCLGPLLFILCASKLLEVIKQFCHRHMHMLMILSYIYHTKCLMDRLGPDIFLAL